MGAFGSAKASVNFLTNNHLPSTEINNVQFNPSYVNSYPHEVDYSQREPSPDYLKGKIMLRTICLIVLLCSSTIMQAHNDNDSLAHRAFWWSENGNPILDGNGQCIRNGSWESLGKPKCLADATDAEPEAAPATETETEIETELAVEPTPELVSEPTVKVVTYSYPVELITTHILFDFDKNNLRVDQQEKIELALMKARNAYTIFKVSLGGHADSRGTDNYNYDLSQRRINTAVNYLNLRDMQTDTTMAWGESQLIINADGSENFELSRRVELVIKVQQKVAD
jgi:outer membrane protein OmpA-like peptidoglycan-associated protein